MGLGLDDTEDRDFFGIPQDSDSEMTQMRSDFAPE